MKNKPIFICLIGIDGSGKTSLAKLAVSALQKEGLDIRYTYGGVQSYLLRPVKFITSRIFLKNQSPFVEYAQYQSHKSKLSKRYRLLAWVYGFVYWLDFSLQTFFKESLPLAMGHSLVVDRYVFDTAINLGYNIDNGKPSLNSLNTFLTIFPKPTLLYLVDVDEEIAFSRKTDTPSIEYLKERRNLYFQMTQRYEGRVIDGSTGREEQVGQICQDVQQWVSSTPSGSNSHI